MPVALLTLLKLVLLALLYLFLYRAVRAVVTDLYGPGKRAAAPPPRPRIAQASPPRRARKIPKELVVHPPSGSPRVVALDDSPVRLGRAEDAHVVVDDVYVSDVHAEISLSDDGWAVRDLGSTNGTYLNGAKVTQATPLTAGDQLRIGKTRVEVRR